MGANEAKDALARVPVMLAVVKSDGVEDSVTLPEVSTSPLLLSPVAVDGCSVQSPVT
jgi:hypothetical protein